MWTKPVQSAFIAMTDGGLQTHHKLLDVQTATNKQNWAIPRLSLLLQLYREPRDQWLLQLLTCFFAADQYGILKCLFICCIERNWHPVCLSCQPGQYHDSTIACRLPLLLGVSYFCKVTMWWDPLLATRAPYNMLGPSGPWLIQKCTSQNIQPSQGTKAWEGR